MQLPIITLIILSIVVQSLGWITSLLSVRGVSQRLSRGGRHETSINGKRWTEQEDVQLGELVDLHGDDWMIIAKEMGNTRTPASVSARWRRKLKNAVTDMVNRQYQQAFEGIKEMPPIHLEVVQVEFDDVDPDNGEKDGLEDSDLTEKEASDNGEGDDNDEEDDEGDAGVVALNSESPESKQEKKERRQDMQRAIRRLRKYKPSIKVYRKRRVIRNI